MTENPAKKILERNFLFRELPEPLLDQLAGLSQRRRFDKGDIVFAEGDTGNALYGVISGVIRITTSNADGKQVFLNMMERGDVFGEVSVIDGEPRTATAEAADTASLFLIRRDDFMRLLPREPIVAIHLLKLLCQRLRSTTDFIHESMLLPVPGRIAKRLLHLAAEHGSETQDGLELGMSQGDLASFLGVSRQIVNITLQDWREHGWIDLRRSRIVIHDRQALEQLPDTE